MTHYVDGFVLPIRSEHVEEYRRIAEAAAGIWREHGAIDYRECVGDDLETECSGTFPGLVGAADGETVVFAWAVYESREARDAANEKIIADPRMQDLMERLQPILDPKRMAHGGFRTLAHANEPSREQTT